MCGRFALFVAPDDLARLYGVTIEDLSLEPRYNISPKGPVLIVRTRPEDGRQLALAQWSLVPSWTKDLKSLGNTWNARAETVRVKPSYRAASRPGAA